MKPSFVIHFKDGKKKFATLYFFAHANYLQTIFSYFFYFIGFILSYIFTIYKKVIVPVFHLIPNFTEILMFGINCYKLTSKIH